MTREELKQNLKGLPEEALIQIILDQWDGLMKIARRLGVNPAKPVKK